jgi:predicted nucleic acid-binding protein
MTLVVADTGPIRYLIVIGAIDVLPKLFQKVVIPAAVAAELSNPKAPETVRKWLLTLPSWMEVRMPANIEFEKVLDRGEAEAISLAIELQATTLLLDETEGRKVARKRGLPVAGTIGILEKAAENKLIDFQNMVAELAKTNFRMDPSLVRDALQRIQSTRE